LARRLPPRISDDRIDNSVERKVGGKAMTKRMTRLASAAFLALGALAVSNAQAAYVTTFEEVGSNVVEVGGGTIDLQT
jgi:hypothetical protein